MQSLRIGKNIVRLRREKKITQEQLAAFIGVTKASVSKWENGQTTPDILLLPQLAAYFDVTVDALIGYCPQLSKDQIEKRYQELAAAFTVCPFDEVIEKTKQDVRQYYSCYPYLIRICTLWINHYMLAKEKETQEEVLHAILEVCGHIRENCKDTTICSDAVGFQALVYLQEGKAKEAIGLLEEEFLPDSWMRQKNGLLITAYMMDGDRKKAESFSQLTMYCNLLSLLGNAGQYLTVKMEDLSVCEETISRIEELIRVYEIRTLHPNNAAVFEYQAAMCYLTHGETEKAIVHLEAYVECIEELFSKETLYLHGDSYFSMLDEWLEQSSFSKEAPRSRELVLKDVRQSFANPAFACLKGNNKFERLKRRVEAL